MLCTSLLKMSIVFRYALTDNILMVEHRDIPVDMNGIIMKIQIEIMGMEIRVMLSRMETREEIISEMTMGTWTMIYLRLV